VKIATQKIIERLPMLKDKIPNYDSVLLEERTLAELDKTKQTFLKMIWFFEEPRKNDFNIGDIQTNVDPSWVSFALECIMTYFQKDTYLTEEPDFSLITDETEYLSPSECAQHFTQNGLDFSRQKFNVYVQRGNIPEPDLIIGDRKFWLKETCDAYLESNVNKQESN